jgi:flagellin FlaB
MGLSYRGRSVSSRGITGLETAIILIAFVVVATVFAFTVLSTGVFSAERTKETIYAGLQEARSSLEPRGSIIAYSGGNGSGTPTTTVYKATFVVGNSASGAAVDLTPPYTANASSIDPDFSSGAEYHTVISYTDRFQHLNDLPWTVEFLGDSSGDFLLEVGEKAEITAWILARNYDVTNVLAADATAMWVADSRGASGILSVGGTLLTPNDIFTLEVKPAQGSVMTLQRTVPVRLDEIMDLQ